MNNEIKDVPENKVQTETAEKTVEQVKLEGVVERLKQFLVDENVTIVPKVTYRDVGIFADIEIRLLEEPVKNIYEGEKSA